MDCIKMGKIMQTQEEANPKKHKVFLTDSLEALENKEFLGGADSYQEACLAINEGVATRGLHQEPYWRVLLAKDATYIDFGSWSKFAAIVPPVDMKELT